MRKYTKAIAGALALVSAVTAFSGCTGSSTTSGTTADNSKRRGYGSRTCR